jgi:Uma2 family endonuclease
MASPTQSPPAPIAAPSKIILPLENGDHMTRDEFERRYAAMPNVKKAELIEGVVFMPSPVRRDQHGTPHIAIGTWLGVYWSATPGVTPADNSTVRLDLDNEPQPDALLNIDPRCGGQVQEVDGYIVGAPELVVEVAASSASIDRNTKLRVYRRNSVREYLIWRVLDNAIDWFVLRQGQYDSLTPHPDGTLRSEVFPGLWLDVDALLRWDMAQVLRVLQRGLASAEHAAFVVELQRRAGTSP